MVKEKPLVWKENGKGLGKKLFRKKFIIAGGGILAIIAVVFLIFEGPQPSDGGVGPQPDNEVEPSGVYIEFIDGKPQLFVNGEPFVVRGVAYAPTPVGQNVEVGYNWWIDSGTYTNDFPMLKQMGANTIRTYDSTGATQEALDAAYSNGIYVIMGYWVNHYADLSNTSVRQNMIDDFVSIVQTWKNHPAVLMWSFGNEVEYNYSGNAEDWYTLLQEAAQAAHEEEGENYHPVTTAHIDIGHGKSRIGEASVKADDASLSALDVWGLNSYRGYSFGNFFTDYAAKSTKPFIMTEFGCDAWNGTSGAEDQSTQASYISSQWLEIESNLGPAGVCLGGTVFEWCDEWWKAGSPSSHTKTAQWQNGSYTDPNMNEEWWGITASSPGTYEKTPREAYYTLKGFWTGTVTPDFTLSVSPASGTVQPGGSAEVTVQVSAQGGYAESVSLSHSGEPSGVTVDFSQPSGTPTFSSTMTINVGATAAQGSYTITITGTGADTKTHTCAYSLVISTESVQPYVIYGDSGFGRWQLGVSAVYTWSGADWGGPTDSFDADYSGESPPEGTKCFKTTSGADWDGSTNYAGWGYYNPEDLSAYAGGHLKFYVKTPINLKVEIKDTSTRTKYISQYEWTTSDANVWKEISIPLNDFGANLSNITLPFLITIEQGSKTFYIDHVRWTA